MDYIRVTTINNQTETFHWEQNNLRGLYIFILFYLIESKIDPHSKFHLYFSYTVVIISLLYFVLPYYSHKSWTNFKTSVSFGICWSWQFQNTPYMSILTKFRLRYWMLKTHDTILLFSWDFATFEEALLPLSRFTIIFQLIGLYSLIHW